MPRIVIVGGGISGLALAYRLGTVLPGAEVLLLEAASRLGGKIHTERRDGFQVECGPNGFLDTKPSTLNLCHDLGLSASLLPASEASRRDRFLFLQDRLHRLPSGPGGLLTTSLLTLAGKLALLREPFRRRGNDPEESVQAFFRRRLGEEAASVFGDALVTGIHGGDPALLSMRAAFPRVAQLEAEHGSVLRGFLQTARQRRRDAKRRGDPKPAPNRMWSFQGGLQDLIDTLTQRLAQTPITGVAARRLERTATGWIVHGEGRDSWPADVVVLTCPADQQSTLVGDLDSELAADIAGIPAAPIAVVALGFRIADVPRVPSGFGFIAPQATRRDLLGVQWCSSIFPGRAPAGCVLWRALCGGWHRPEIVNWSDDRLLNAVREEIKLASGVTASPVFHHLVRWPRAIPQYHVGHLDRVARIQHRAAQHPGLILAGNSYHGVALNDCTEQAELIAARLARAE